MKEIAVPTGKEKKNCAWIEKSLCAEKDAANSTVSIATRGLDGRV